MLRVLADRRQVLRILHEDIPPSSTSRSHHTRQARTCPQSSQADVWWAIPRSPRTRHHHRLCRSDRSSMVPVVSLPFIRLPGKVHVAFPTSINVDLTCLTCRMLMATLRYLAHFPCPHCMILRSQIGDMGLVADMKRRTNAQVFPTEAVNSARKRIFEKGGSVNYRGNDDRLTNTGSWVPTEVSFARTAPLTVADNGLPRMDTMCHWGYSRSGCSSSTSCTTTRSGCSR